MPPALPSPIKGISVTKGDGTKALVVSLTDAGKLMAVSREHIKRWVQRGKVEICVDPKGDPLVFVDSLWALVPEEFQRG